MVSGPIMQDGIGNQGNALIDQFASVKAEHAHSARPEPELETSVGQSGRHLAIYPARAGYDLQDELDFLTNRVAEPNIFFSARFLAPAMPRLEDRLVRLIAMRDEDGSRSRMRMLMPFSIERPGFSVGAPIIRVWANPYGPLGTPLVDAEGAAETLDNMLEGLGRAELGLPGVLVLPDLRLDGPVASLLRAIAIGRNLPLTETGLTERPTLESKLEADEYLAGSMTKNHRREMRRQWRKLAELGDLQYDVARQPADIQVQFEEFLALEDSGWKGKRRSAMVADRYRAAFAREAVNNLATTDNVRIHTINLDGEAVASMIVLITAGEAWTWKTAYDEAYRRFSPGKLLMDRLTEWHLDDANIHRTDSCAEADHPVMSRFWRERQAMGTLVIGLQPNRDRDVRQVAAQLHIYRNTRNVARVIRDKIRSLTRR